MGFCALANMSVISRTTWSVTASGGGSLGCAAEAVGLRGLTFIPMLGGIA
jgi:hypothetical protein